MKLIWPQYQNKLILRLILKHANQYIFNCKCTNEFKHTKYFFVLVYTSGGAYGTVGRKDGAKKPFDSKNYENSIRPPV